MVSNNGSNFSNGVFIFEVEEFKIFIINNILYYQNKEKQNGCLYFLIQNFINQIINIRDSDFIQKQWRCDINLKCWIKDEKLQNFIQLCKQIRRRIVFVTKRL
ncbi:unnamed protein product [Paramecium sonneborni]|uniref:Uncharacterized protein n=1 Tax=Paramecium sonneborni TaxID=65129 RepID=A0A8S1RKR2_9CILI|nr:unnamed protein product [Paramecium sonneborni]